MNKWMRKRKVFRSCGCSTVGRHTESPPWFVKTPRGSVASMRPGTGNRRRAFASDYKLRSGVGFASFGDGWPKQSRCCRLVQPCGWDCLGGWRPSLVPKRVQTGNRAPLISVRQTDWTRSDPERLAAMLQLSGRPSDRSRQPAKLGTVCGRTASMELQPKDMLKRGDD